MAMTDVVTPVILTCDEAPNIARTLEKLRWARDVVIVDSGSRDATLDIARGFGNVRTFHRTFDSHAAQWTYAIRETGIATPWVLALDADFVLSDDLVEELRTLPPGDDVSGYRARFVYCVDGKPLRRSLYPPVTVLFRPDRAGYLQDGHTHRVRVRGRVKALQAAIYHDDRKPVSRWIASQKRYMRLEAEKLAGATAASLSWPDRVRLMRIVAPGAVALYCLFWKGLVLDGRAGLVYALQRTYAELLLSLYLLEGDFAALARGRRRA